MKLATVAEMVAIEKAADASGLTYAEMMQNAGAGLAGAVAELAHDGQRSGRHVLALVGPGNNGGDALVASTLLAADAWDVTAYLVKRTPDDLVDHLQKAGGKIVPADTDPGFKSLSASIASADIFIDGLLGTGTKLPVRGEVGEVLREAGRLVLAQSEPPLVVAVDCPSGIDCDTGEVTEHCIAADLTVTMAAVKQGLLRLPAYDYVGDLQVVDIGLPEDLPGLAGLPVEVAGASLVARILPPRPSDSHKGTFGTAVVAAGSVNYTGAALLAAKAAYRVGAGLVTLAVPSPLHPALAGQFPEATWLLLPHELGVISRDAASVLVTSLSRASALLVGPGLGIENTTADFLQRLLQAASGAAPAAAQMGFVGASENAAPGAGRILPPMVVDADGLRLLTRIPDWHRRLPAESVLTPHPGEMAVLTGLSKDDIQRNRVSVAAKYAREWGQVVVLKGAFTLIAAPDGRLTVIPVATAALARAGTGDVLAGLITGLRAQGVDPYGAAIAGAWIHAQAGLFAASTLGNEASVMAGDILDSVADVISDLPTT